MEVAIKKGCEKTTIKQFLYIDGFLLSERAELELSYTKG